MLENNLPNCLIYLFYGLAFYFLGISIAVKRLKASRLRLAGSLPLLAAFGFLHGSHEWLDLYIFLQSPHISTSTLYWTHVLTNFLALASFYFLLQFGISLGLSRGRRAASVASAAIFLGWTVFIWYNRYNMDEEMFNSTDLLIRNFFGLLSGVMTSFALVSYSKEVKGLSRSVSRNLFYAGVVFAIYGILAGLIPSRFVIPVLGVQIELLRGLAATLIAIFIIKALNIFDIETRRKIEAKLKRLAQTEKLASLGRLAAGAAHEINNPLANASIGMQMLRARIMQCQPDEKVLEKFESVERNMDRASLIAREMLRFSRPEEAEFVRLDLNGIIEEALSHLQYKFEGVRVSKSLSSVPEVVGDRVKLEQVLIDLLDNGIEAMPDGGEISIKTSNSGGKVRVDISDMGQGIPERNLTRVFDPFFTTKEVGKGTGLGLSICHGIISQHDGNIEITSTEGKGTTVSFTIPVAG